MHAHDTTPTAAVVDRTAAELAAEAGRLLAELLTVLAKLPLASAQSVAPEPPEPPWSPPLTFCAAEDPAEVDPLLTLDQLAGAVGRSKRTLERYRKRMPPPTVRGRNGQANYWLWSTVRPWLEQQFGFELDPHRPIGRRPFG